nr:protein FAR1-RELATED SEQUENCE 5-like [Lolium perenne]
MIAKCSCKLFECKGILCRHIIRVFRASKLNELPSIYVLKRWEKKCKRDAVYDGEGNLLEENAISSAETAIRRKIATARNMVEEIIRDARTSEEVIDFVNTGLSNLQSSLVQKFQTVPPTRHEEQETFIGTSIPTQVAVLTASDTCSRGTCARIRGHRDDAKRGAGKKKKKDPNLKVPRQCDLCKEVGFHDARKCPKKT